MLMYDPNSCVGAPILIHYPGRTVVRSVVDDDEFER
jgi:hypothetical protein